VKKTFVLNDFARSLEFMELPPALRGFAFACHTFCAERETLGLIRNAGTFTGAMWRGLLGRGGNRKTVDALEGAGLVRWRGLDLEIVGYDVDAEQTYRAKRESGRKGGVASGEIRKGAEVKPERLPTDDPSTASTTPSSTPVRERRGNEGEGGDCEVPDLSTSSPFGLVVAFEAAYLAKRGTAYATTGGDYGAVADLVLQYRPENWAGLARRISLFLEGDLGDSLAGFCEAEAASLPADRGAA
jgi:hypothetical protein